MRWKDYLFKKSSLITDIEINTNPTIDLIEFAYKDLYWLSKYLNDSEKSKHKTIILDMIARLKNVEIKGNEDKEKIQKLKNDIDILKTIIQVWKSEE